MLHPQIYILLEQQKDLDPGIYIYIYLYVYTYIHLYIYTYIASFQYLCFMDLFTVASKIVNIIVLFPLLLTKKKNAEFQNNDNLCNSKPSFMKS